MTFIFPTFLSFLPFLFFFSFFLYLFIYSLFLLVYSGLECMTSTDDSLFVFVFQLLRSTNLGPEFLSSSDLHLEDEMSAASYGLHAYTVRYTLLFFNIFVTQFVDVFSIQLCFALMLLFPYCRLFSRSLIRHIDSLPPTNTGHER